MGVSGTSAFMPVRHHAATEIVLRESSLARTALRHTYYATSRISRTGDALKTGLLGAPADGKVTWTAHAELAEAAAAWVAYMHS